MDECLSETQKRRFADYFYREQSLQAIAEKEGTSAVAIWKSIMGAKKKIKKFLAQA